MESELDIVQSRNALIRAQRNLKSAERERIETEIDFRDAMKSSSEDDRRLGQDAMAAINAGGDERGLSGLELLGTD